MEYSLQFNSLALFSSSGRSAYQNTASNSYTSYHSAETLLLLSIQNTDSVLSSADKNDLCLFIGYQRINWTST